MTKHYREKQEAVVNAIQFDGANFAEIQAEAGVHYFDLAQAYPIPNFDAASTWGFNHGAESPDTEAVFWTASGWNSCSPGQWIIFGNGDTGLSVLSNEEFLAKFEEDTTTVGDKSP